jgi:predicted nucleotidyltransferase
VFGLIFRGVLGVLAGSKARTRVLGVLLKFPSKEFTGRELALSAAVSQPQAGEALKVFRDNGLVSCKQVGKAFVWKLNEKHFLAGPLGQADEPFDAVASAIVSEVAKRFDLSKVVKMVVFGSVARRSERPSSDLDLLVVVRDASDKGLAAEKVLDASLELASVFGNPVMPVVFSAKEMAGKPLPALLKNIEKEGIVIYPKE